MDFYNTIYYAVGRTPYTWGGLYARAYLPFVYMMLYPLTHTYGFDPNDYMTVLMGRSSQLAAVAGAMFFVCSFAILLYCLYRLCKGPEPEKLGVLAALLLSGTTIYSVERGNLMLLAAGLTGIYLLTWDSPKKYIRHIGFLCLAGAAALKMFPALFGVLLLYKKRYKDAFWAIVYGISFVVLPFFLLKGSVTENIRLYFTALGELRKAYFPIGDFGFSAPTILWPQHIEIKALPMILCVIAILTASAAKTGYKQIMLLSMAIMMTSGQQMRYCLLLLYYPFVWFLYEEKSRKDDWLFLAGFILLNQPLRYELKIGWLLFTPYTVANTICIILYLYLLVQCSIDFCRAMRARKSPGADGTAA